MSLRVDTARMLENIRARLLTASPPPVIIRPVGVGNSLYGVLIKVEGVGVIGQYLSHSEFTVTGPDGKPERYWEIIYGVSEVFARVEMDGVWALIPVIVYGMVTPDGRRLLERGPFLVEHKRVKGSIIVPVSAIVNLEDVMNGSDAMLRIDPHGVAQPGDLRERVVSLSKQLAALKQAYATLESEYARERSAREIAESQLIGFRTLLDSFKAQIAVTSTTLAQAESALLDMWARLRAQSTRVASERELRERMEAILSEMSEVIETARGSIRKVRELIAEAARIEGEGAPPAEEEKPAQEEGAGEQERGEGEGGE